ncbi:MAG: hypothetical protein RL220_932, partial [Bacteroidota bacterium]
SNGQLAGSVYKGILPAGRNRVLTDGTQFAPGTYTAVVTGEDFSISSTFVIQR